MFRLGIGLVAAVAFASWWWKPTQTVSVEVATQTAPRAAPALLRAEPVSSSVPEPRPIPSPTPETEPVVPPPPTRGPALLEEPHPMEPWPGWRCADLEGETRQSLWFYDGAEEGGQIYDGTCAEWANQRPPV